jgi:hypothetical protein
VINLLNIQEQESVAQLVNLIMQLDRQDIAVLNMAVMVLNTRRELENVKLKKT